MLRNLTISALLAVLLSTFIPGRAGALTLSDKMHGRISKGNKHYDAEEHDRALENYMKAQGLDSTSAIPHFNAGDAFYRLGKFPEGAQEFLRSSSSPTDSIAAMSYYNLGNTMFSAGDFESAAEAYRRSLLIEPDDEDAKFNLELAMKMMEQQEQEQDQQQDQQQQDEQNQDQQDQQQDQQDQEDKQDKEQDEQEQQQQDQQDEEQDQHQQDQQHPQQQEQEDKQQEPQPQQAESREITPEELERILAAIEASDKNTQEEMLKKASRRKTSSGKDW
jgi:tetratricopeptide (TPR) repeat protein